VTWLLRHITLVFTMVFLVVPLPLFLLEQLAPAVSLAVQAAAPITNRSPPHHRPVRFAEKTSCNTVSADLLWEKNTVLADLLWEKNTVPTKKTS